MAEKEYIERETVIDYIDERIPKLIASADGKHIVTVEVIRDVIESFPAANVVPVVRCKDCKYYRNRPNGLCYLHTEPYGDGYKGDAVCVEDNDFCSYGERKELDSGKIH